MAQWNVSGADRTTGTLVTKTVEAASQEDAIRKAGKSMFIEKVEPFHAVDLTFAAPIPSAAVTPNKPRSKPAPPYTAINVVATMMNVLGGVGIAGGAIMAVIGFMQGQTSGVNVTAIEHGMQSLVSGVMLLFFASISHAIRDIAINSFNR